MKLTSVFGALLLGGAAFFSISARAQESAPVATNAVASATNTVPTPNDVDAATTNAVAVATNAVAVSTNEVVASTNAVTAVTNVVITTTNLVTTTTNVTTTTTTSLVTTTSNLVATTTNQLAETTNLTMDTTSPMTDTADLIIYNAKVVTVNSSFAVDQAIAVRDGWILGVGKDRQLEHFRGPATLMIDAQGHTVMPGLYDAHVNSYEASVSEWNGPLPAPDSIETAQDYIRKRAAKTAPGTWIVLEQLYPTRLKEGRLPTKGELDVATTNHPVCWNFGPMAVVNSMALDVSKITKATSDPRNGEVVKDPKTFKPTGLLRNGMSLLKIPPAAHPPTLAQRRAALKRLYQLYNQEGITSIGEERAETNAIDLFRDLSRTGELTVRINCARVLDTLATADDTIARLDTLTNAPAGKLPYGPTGVGNDWVRIGPLKTILDGDVAVGTAYLRTPYGIGPTYKIEEPAYRGDLKPDPYVLPEVLQEAAQRGWQLSAHCAGDAALDMVLNCYEQIQFKLDIRERRFLISHNDFQAEQDWDRCVKLGVCADLQPGCLYEDGSSLLSTLGQKRLQNFLPLKTWFSKGLVVGGGSEHTARLDSHNAAAPWSPWLGMWITLTRQTSAGDVINPEEQLTREQAIKFYTINNAWMNFEEKRKGSLEPGKYADLVMIDRDILKCPVEEIRDTKALLTLVNGKIVWEAKPVVLPGPQITSVTVVTNITVTNVSGTVATTNQTQAVAATNSAPTVTGTNASVTAAVTSPAPAIAITNQNPVVSPANRPPSIAATSPASTVVVTNYLPGSAASNAATTIMVSVTVTNQLPAVIAPASSTAANAASGNVDPVAVANQPANVSPATVATIPAVAPETVSAATNTSQTTLTAVAETTPALPVATVTTNEAAAVASPVQPTVAAPVRMPPALVAPPGVLVVRARGMTNSTLTADSVTNQTAATTGLDPATIAVTTNQVAPVAATNAITPIAVTNQPAPAVPTTTNQVVDPLDWSHLMGGSKTPH